MNNVKIPEGRERREWVPFTVMSEQFLGIGKILGEQLKVSRPMVTKETQDRIEDKLLSSLLSEEEVLVTYYEEGYVLTSYMTVVHINPMKQTVTCTDAFYRTHMFTTIDIIDVK
ncbi:YolD-like family protein [Bacillus clarus]|uniref:YolD-like family protein n=1 Tax=Bacillus clarus TaxID=2338372 RepID=A0A090YL52_9BACI|nr:YolD-like family protein [Bacillus clarus]KFM98627.1 yolD-like family protein [Bacillus clarus]RFT67567.1 YolD-like family protein [Bacillus clarus]